MEGLNVRGESNLRQIKTDSSFCSFGGGRPGPVCRVGARDPFLFYVRVEVNRGDVAASRDVRESGKGTGSPQPLYKLFLLSPWVLFRVLIYRRH